MISAAVTALALLQGAAFDPGPPVGAAIPAFEAPDQSGKLRHFEDLRGPSGLALLFFRSADW